MGCDNLNYQSDSFESSQDLTIKHILRYFNGALVDGRVETIEPSFSK